MRCYNGCPDSELQALLNANAEAHKRLNAVDERYSVTYFPNGGFWQVFLDNIQVGAEHQSLIHTVNVEISRRGIQ